MRRSIICLLISAFYGSGLAQMSATQSKKDKKFLNCLTICEQTYQKGKNILGNTRKYISAKELGLQINDPRENLWTATDRNYAHAKLKEKRARCIRSCKHPKK